MPINSSLIATPDKNENIDTNPMEEDGLEVVEWDDMILSPDNGDTNVQLNDKSSISRNIQKGKRNKRIKKTSFSCYFRSNL